LSDDAQLREIIKKPLQVELAIPDANQRPPGDDVGVAREAIEGGHAERQLLLPMDDN
jgi:hypothetical protein